MVRFALAALLFASTAHTQTWLDLTVAPEVECATYDRAAYGFDARRHRDVLAAEVTTAPYSGDAVPSEPSGRDWHVEHIVALREAAASGLCGSERRRDFANDRANLTLARASLNIAKGARDAAEWLPPTAAGRCFLARTVIRVKRAYELTVDQAEAEALERVLLDRDCGPSFMSYWSLVGDPRGWRDAYRSHQADRRRADAAARRARQRAAFEARVASWRPPARVWRIGALLFWTAPASGPMPGGYRVEEGDTVSHPWHRHDGRAVYEHVLRTRDPARIEAEHGGGLSHRIYSRDVTAGPEPAGLVGRIRYYASRPWRSQASRDRWRRVLAGFGVPCGVGHGSRPPVCGLEPAMTADEAQRYADRGWSQYWGHAADVLRRIEQRED